MALLLTDLMHVLKQAIPQAGSDVNFVHNFTSRMKVMQASYRLLGE